MEIYNNLCMYYGIITWSTFYSRAAWCPALSSHRSSILSWVCRDRKQILTAGDTKEVKRIGVGWGRGSASSTLSCSALARCLIYYIMSQNLSTPQSHGMDISDHLGLKITSRVSRGLKNSQEPKNHFIFCWICTIFYYYCSSTLLRIFHRLCIPVCLLFLHFD